MPQNEVHKNTIKVLYNIIEPPLHSHFQLLKVPFPPAKKKRGVFLQAIRKVPPTHYVTIAQLN